MSSYDEKLSIDIDNTLLEYKAYQKIAEGFYILSKLPENTDSSRISCIRNYDAYTFLADGCKNFLDELMEKRDERNLIQNG